MTSSHQTAEQAKAEYVKSMGKALGELYAELWQELVRLHRNWGEYVELYGTKPSRIELVNRAAPAFFRAVQDALWEQTLLHIARLTDPPKSAGRDNLSIQQILPLVNDKKAKALIATKISDALQAAKFCRDWRNRRIAHRDLDLALKEAAEPLAPASRANVKNALERLSDVVNEVSRHYRDAETHFEGTYDRGAHGLLYLLDTALEIQEERLARLKQGEYRPEEWRRKEL